jgi:hypothetical protein
MECENQGIVANGRPFQRAWQRRVPELRSGEEHIQETSIFKCDRMEQRISSFIVEA